jgi:hypothetical protein
MGLIIRFPLERRIGRDGRSSIARAECATVTILPVVRIERDADEPSDGMGKGAGGGHRPRASRS